MDFIPYQYEDVLSDIQDRFNAKGYSDVVNEGSEANKLSTIVAGVLSNMALNLNNNISEMLISTAKKEANILANAQDVLGYQRIQNISYQYNISVKAKKDTSLPDDDTSKRIYTLEKYSYFTSNGNTYYYLGDHISRSLSNNDITTDIEDVYFNITVKEGTLYRYINTPELVYTVSEYVTSSGSLATDTHTILLYNNIENEGVELFVTYTDNKNTLYTDEPWTQSSSMLIENTDEQNKFITIEDYNSGYYKVYWRYAGIGISLKKGSVVKINILTSKGSLGEYDGVSFLPQNSLYETLEFNETAGIFINGVSKEGTEEVAVNAPRFNNTANRAITRPDYIALSERRPKIKQVMVWGSEDEIPSYNRESFFSYIPSYVNTDFSFDLTTYTYSLNMDESFYMSDTEVQDVFNYYKEYQIPSLKHKYRHPSYIDFVYKIEIVRYDSTKSILSTNESIFTEIKNYFNSQIEKFSSEYFNAAIIKRIHNITSDISGINTELTITTDINSTLFNVLYGNNESEYTYVLNLAYPYDYPFNIVTGEIYTDKLPVIDTPLFNGGEFGLIVDYENQSNHYGNIAFDIYIDEVEIIDEVEVRPKIGKYIVVQGVEEYIRVELYAVDTSSTIGPGAQTHIETTLVLSDFVENATLNIIYPDDNFYMYRNSIPRLKQIEFIV